MAVTGITRLHLVSILSCHSCSSRLEGSLISTSRKQSDRYREEGAVSRNILSLLLRCNEAPSRNIMSGPAAFTIISTSTCCNEEKASRKRWYMVKGLMTHSFLIVYAWVF